MEQRGCERGKDKWNNLKGSAKARVDCSRREARRTRGRPNEAGEVEDEDILIHNSDKEMSTFVTEKLSQMLSRTPDFSGISGSVDLLNPQQHCLHKQRLFKPVMFY